MPRIPDSRLKTQLDLLYARYGAGFLDSDPICFPRLFARPDDREVMAFLATALAYGRVPQIQASLRRLAGLVGPSPARFVREFDPAEGGSLLHGFVHRFNDAQLGRDLRPPKSRALRCVIRPVGSDRRRGGRQRKTCLLRDRLQR